MAGSTDPLGKRALFWYPGDERTTARAGGKRALFSDAPPAADEEPVSRPDDPLPAQGWFVVECSRCAAVTRVGLLDLIVLQLPVGWWLPRGPFDRRMTCPSCRRRSWMSVTISR